MRIVQIPKFSKFADKLSGFASAEPSQKLMFSTMGVSMVAIISGFSVCVYDDANMQACVAHAESVLDMIEDAGNYLIERTFALINAIFDRYPSEIKIGI